LTTNELAQAEAGGWKRFLAMGFAGTAALVQLPGPARFVARLAPAGLSGAAPAMVVVGLGTMGLRLVFEAAHAQSSLALGHAAKGTDQGRRLAGRACAVAPFLPVAEVLEFSLGVEVGVTGAMMALGVPLESIETAQKQQERGSPDDADTDASREASAGDEVDGSGESAVLLRQLLGEEDAAPQRPAAASPGRMSELSAGARDAVALTEPAEHAAPAGSKEDRKRTAVRLTSSSLVGLRALRKLWWRTARAVVLMEAVDPRAVAAAEAALAGHARS